MQDAVGAKVTCDGDMRLHMQCNQAMRLVCDARWAPMATDWRRTPVAHWAAVVMEVVVLAVPCGVDELVQLVAVPVAVLETHQLVSLPSNKQLKTKWEGMCQQRSSANSNGACSDISQ